MLTIVVFNSLKRLAMKRNWIHRSATILHDNENKSFVSPDF